MSVPPEMTRQPRRESSSASAFAFFTTCAAYFLNAGVFASKKRNRRARDLVHVRATLQARKHGAIYQLRDINAIPRGDF